MKASRFINK